MSRHTIRLHNVVVGWSDLETADPVEGRASGQFRPGVGYELVQPVFGLYAQAVPEPGAEVADPQALDRYHRSRDALGLSLEDDQGRVIRTSAIHIEDYSGAKGSGRKSGLTVEVLISDQEYWKRRSRPG